MIIHKGPHLKLEIEALVEYMREQTEGQFENYSILNFINQKAKREFVDPLNEYLRRYYYEDAITRCEFVRENSFTGASIKLHVDISTKFANDLQKEDVLKQWPF